MKNTIFLLIGLCWMHGLMAQNVGIGTNSPVAGLHLANNNGMLAIGVSGQGSLLPNLGQGTRLVWYPRKSAFRVGTVNGSSDSAVWNDENIGTYSTAIGFNTLASGTVAFAGGLSAKATGYSATALGAQSEAIGAYGLALGGQAATARGINAVAIGNNAYANSVNSIAIGQNVNAGLSVNEGHYAVALGFGTTKEFGSGGHYATGVGSFVIGNSCRAVANGSFAVGNGNVAGADFYFPTNGINSFALGNSCRASGNFSFAIGNNANTNGRSGSFVIAGRTDGMSVSTALDNHMLMQFAGGYHFQTNLAASMGVYLQPGGNSWLSFSDSTKKESALLMDDEAILRKLASINYYSWKYKEEPDVHRRNYGVMAQDFYAAFGNDGAGTIGNDSLVNPIDMLGVAFSAIKALEKRTAELDELKLSYALLREQLTENQHRRLRTKQASHKKEKKLVAVHTSPVQ